MLESEDDQIEKDNLKRVQQELNHEALTYYGNTAMSEKYSISELTSDKIFGVYSIAEKQPEPPGGMSGFYRYIAENLVYPPEARSKCTEGKVFVKFIVTKNGKFEAVQVLKGIGDGCDIEVISQSAEWMPGENGGGKVYSE